MIAWAVMLVLSAEPVPPQPPPEGHFIVDVPGVVSPQARADVDELAMTIHAGGFGELMVLVVDSSGGVPLAKYGTKVFSQWPVGHAENVDGALLVVAMKEKACALVLGDSFVAVSTKEIEGLVAAKLKDGKADDAVREGARAVLRLLEGKPAAAVPDAGKRPRK